MLASVSVPETVQGAELLAALTDCFEGDLEATVVQIPAKAAGKFVTLPKPFEASGLLEHAAKSIGNMLQFLKPPQPATLADFCMQLPEGGAVKAAQQPKAAAAAGAEAATGATGTSWVVGKAAFDLSLAKAIESNCRDGKGSITELTQLAEVPTPCCRCCYECCL